MSRTKDLIKNTGILMVGKVSTQFVSFLLLPLYTNKLSTGEYGILDLYTTIAGILIPILTLQLEQGVFRFMVTSEEKKENVVTSTFAYLIFVALVMTIVFLPVARVLKLDDVVYVYGYYLTYMFYIVVVQLARGEGNNALYSFASFLSSLLIIIFNIIFLLPCKMGVEGILLSHVISYVATIFMVIVLLGTFQYIKVSFFSIDCLKRLLKYSIPLVFNQISSWIINYSDRIIIVAVLGVSTNGIYALANKFFSLLVTVFNIYNMAWTELVAKTMHDEDRNDYYRKVINLTIQIYLLLSIWVIAGLGVAFKLFINASYHDAYNYIPILVVAAIFSGLSATMGSIYIGHKETKSIGITTMGAAIVNAIVHVALIGFIGLYAASISTLVAFIVLFIYRIYGLRKIERVKINVKIFIVLVPVLMVVCYLYLTGEMLLQVLSIVIALIVTVLILFKNKDFILSLKKTRK